MRNCILLLVLLLQSLTAFSQRGTSGDSGLWQPLWQARAIAYELLELDSLRGITPILQRRIGYLEQYRRQAHQRAAQDSTALAQRSMQLDARDRQLLATNELAKGFELQARKYRRQRNLVVVCGFAAAAALTTVIIKSGHPP